eukprot:scaffold1434_cov107-Cylindrotheca_fusiformis.AAC.6
MTIVAHFTPGYGTLGGALIGFSAAILLLVGGEILGASGLVSSTALYPRQALTDPGVAWKILLIAIFMLLSNTVLAAHFSEDDRLSEDASIPIVSTAGYLIGGFFVGFGTRLGNGCTTGHGICGMARMSKRSFTAVATFMVSAISTANLVAPDNKATKSGTAFLRTDKAPDLFNRWIGFGVTMPLVLASLLALYNLRRSYLLALAVPETEESDTPAVECAPQNKLTDGDVEDTSSFKGGSCSDVEAQASEETVPEQGEVEHKNKVLSRRERTRILDGAGKLKPAALAGITFSIGLAVSGMVQPSKILGFLNLFLLEKGTWDPTLITVMAGGSIVSWISYQFVSGHGIISNSYMMECPRRSSEFSIPTSQIIDCKLITGAMCFGIGWGVSGLCPGPAMFLAASGAVPIILFWWPLFFVGAFIAQMIKDRS